MIITTFKAIYFLTTHISETVYYKLVDLLKYYAEKYKLRL